MIDVEVREERHDRSVVQILSEAADEMCRWYCRFRYEADRAIEQSSERGANAENMFEDKLLDLHCKFCPMKEFFS